MIRLRAPELGDIDFLMETENSDEQQKETAVATGPYSRYQMEQYVKQSTNNVFRDLQLRLMIEDSASRQTMGIVDVTDFNPRHNRAEIGIFISPRFRGKGIATRALEIMKRHCLETLAMHQLYAYIRHDNEPCVRLFEKAGFERAGRLKDWVTVRGRHEDVFIYQIKNIGN